MLPECINVAPIQVLSVEARKENFSFMIVNEQSSDHPLKHENIGVLNYKRKIKKGELETDFLRRNEYWPGALGKKTL